jgi:single-stranded DNA-binding protein
MIHGNNLGVLMGRLTADPDVVPTRRGDRLKVSMRVAVDRPEAGPGAGKKADFFTVVKYGDYDQIVQLAAPLQKGTQVHVSGRWQSRDLRDGRVITEMVADTVVPLDNPRLPEVEKKEVE